VIKNEMDNDFKIPNIDIKNVILKE